MRDRWKLTYSEYAVQDRDSAKAIYSRKRSLQLLQARMDLNGSTGFDYGCAEGLFIDMLRKEGARVFGCDVSADLLRADDPDVWLGSVESLDRIPDNSLDFFADRHCLHTVLVREDERVVGMSHVRRVVKRGGFLLIVMANSLASPASKQLWNPLTFHSELRSSGFEEVEQDFYNMYWPRPLKFLPQTNNTILRTVPLAIKQRRCSAYISLSKKL
jgi:SAM-dependent methyltransferase